MSAQRLPRIVRVGWDAEGARAETKGRRQVDNQTAIDIMKQERRGV